MYWPHAGLAQSLFLALTVLCEGTMLRGLPVPAPPGPFTSQCTVCSILAQRVRAGRCVNVSTIPTTRWANVVSP